MRIRWTVVARSDRVRRYDLLAPVNRQAPAREVRSLQSAPSRLLQHHPASGLVWRSPSRARRRYFVGDYEIRHEILDGVIAVLRVWRTRENR